MGAAGQAEGALERVPDHYADDARDDPGHDHHDSSTRIALNGQPSTVGGLAAGDRFVSLFSGSSSDTIQTLTANPALAVFAHTPPTPKQLYAFVGTVTGTSGTTAPGTVTVTVADSYPSGFFSSPATLTVGANTLILGGSSSTGNGLFGGSLGDVSVGDTVAGVLVAPAGETRRPGRGAAARRAARLPDRRRVGEPSREAERARLNAGNVRHQARGQGQREGKASPQAPQEEVS